MSKFWRISKDIIVTSFRIIILLFVSALISETIIYYSIMVSPMAESSEAIFIFLSSNMFFLLPAVLICTLIIRYALSRLNLYTTKSCLNILLYTALGFSIGFIAGRFELFLLPTATILGTITGIVRNKYE